MEPSYRGHRFPAEIISHAVWLYYRFTLSFRGVEDLLSERGIIVSYEVIRFWCLKFGPGYAWAIRKKRGRLGDIWHVDELFLKINGRQVYLWRAVDQDGDVLDILVTERRDKRAEVSHQHTREKERQVRRFKPVAQAQCVLAVHGQVQNLFRAGRNVLKAIHYRLLRDRAFAQWNEATCAH